MVEGSSVHYVRRWRGKDHAMVMSGANVDGVVTGSGDIGQSSSSRFLYLLINWGEVPRSVTHNTDLGFLIHMVAPRYSKEVLIE
ncbi:hypothetical protein U1Q18_016483 [Sarracenia purpurea var. burkii]